MNTKKKTTIGVLICVALSSCLDSNNAILKGKDFDDGDWFLVLEDGAKRTLFIIDDEKILKENPRGLILGPLADCGGTTCDGFFMLYKNGELVAQHEYLSQADILVSGNIKSAMKAAKQDWIDSNSPSECKNQWDSLSKMKNTYPTRYHTQPDDKDIILYYTYK